MLDICDRPGLLDLDAARSLALGDVSPISGSECVPLSAALGRAVIQDVRSSIPLPAFAQSAVDGFGIHASDVPNPGKPLAVKARIAAGAGLKAAICGGEAVNLLTGAPIPEGVAAVVMREKTDASSKLVRISSPVECGQNIRWQGEDVPSGAILVEAGNILDARHIAILAAAGISEVRVRMRVRVGVISNGNELIDPPQPLRFGQVYDTNRPMLLALLANAAIDVHDLGRVADDCDALSDRLAKAGPRCDLIVSSGGVSGSDADHIVEAVRLAGGVSRRLSIAMKPGKPLAIGHIGATVMLSLPGNCLAAMVGALLFARPVIRALAGARQIDRPAQIARNATRFFHKPGRTEFVPVRVTGCGPDAIPTIATLGKGGSARLRPVTLADGFASIPKDAEEIPEGHLLAYHPFKSDFEL